MINLVYETLKTILNKENAGWVSPTEFNLLAKQVQEKIFRSYFEDENRDKNKENRGLINNGYSNLSFNQRQRIQQFAATPSTVAISGGNYQLPADLYFIEEDGVSTVGGKVVTEVEHSTINHLENSLSASSLTYPVYERYPDYITVKPITYVSDINVRYLRKPADPKWTYTVVSGKELYNPSSTSHQDFELHTSEFSNIVLEMCTYFGINLREEKIVAIAEQLKNTLNVKDNA